jgi:hypothetical protein
MQFASQGNAGAAAGSGDVPLGTWLAVLTVVGAVAHVIALAMVAIRTREDCRWCVFVLGGYAVYVAGMIGYISLSGFLQQVRMSGILSALLNTIPDIVYIAIALTFAVLVVVTRLRALHITGA